MPFIGKRQAKEVDHDRRDKNMTLKTPTKNERKSTRTSLRKKASSLMGGGRKKGVNTNNKKKSKWRLAFTKVKRDETVIPNVTVITPSTVGSGSHTYSSSDRDGFEMVLDHSPLSPQESSRPFFAKTIPNHKNTSHDSQVVTPPKKTAFDYCTDTPDLTDFSVMGADCVSPLADWGKFVSLIVSPPLEVVKDYVFGNDEEEDVGEKMKTNEHHSARTPFDEIDEATFDDESMYTTLTQTSTSVKEDMHPPNLSRNKVLSPEKLISTGEERSVKIDVAPLKSGAPPPNDEEMNERYLNSRSAHRDIVEDNQVDLPHEEIYDTEFTLRFLREVSQIGIMLVHIRVPQEGDEMISTLVNMSIKPGLSRGSRLLEPKLCWKEMNSARRASEYEGSPLTSISLLGIHSIHTSLSPDSDDGTQFFTITTEDGAIHAFEAPTLSERNYIVNGIKNVAAWLSYHLVMGHMASGTELVSDLDEEEGEESGELPSLKTPIQAMNDLTHLFLD